MDIFEAIFTRRSIRKFTDQPVEDKDLELILKSAMLAPSACNEQPWQFVVIRDDARKQEVAHASPYTGMAASSPVVIVVCGDVNAEKAKGFWPQDCSAATENILLAARGLNLGSVWCGIYPEADREANLKRKLGLPDNIIPFALICVGHPEQKFQEADRWDSARVHYEKWQAE